MTINIDLISLCIGMVIGGLATGAFMIIEKVEKVEK